jgi:hypothetical protein
LDAANTTPKEIIARRMVKKGNTAVPQVKLTWVGLPYSASTWEDYYVVKNRFLKQQLGGKLQLKRGEMSHLAITSEAVYVICFTYFVVLRFQQCIVIWAIVARDCNDT